MCVGIPTEDWFRSAILSHSPERLRELWAHSPDFLMMLDQVLVERDLERQFQQPAVEPDRIIPEREKVTA